MQGGYVYNDVKAIVKAISDNVTLTDGGMAPDDATHSPISTRWEVYLISVGEGHQAMVFMPGDVNHDGIVDVTDVTTTISVALGGTPSPFFMSEADLNHDGIIDVTDVTAVISIALNNN